MEFPVSFFEDEVRDGFFVSGKMKVFWAAQLEVLDQIDKICRRHGLTYYADCGTMLGAARHGSFIPWDDDLDISMKRDQLDKLIPIARQELPEGYEVFDLSSEEDYDNLLIRVVNTRSITFDKDFMKANHGCPYAAGLDIFPLDHVAPTPELEDKQCDMIKYVFSLGTCLAGQDKLDQESWKTLRDIAKSCGITFKPEMSIKKRLDLVAEWFMRMYNKEDTEKLTIICNYIDRRSYSFPAKYYEDVIYLPFEGFKMPMAAGYEYILRHEYGDYMRPVRTGSAHDYPGFTRMDEAMRDSVGGIWCGYNFKPEDLEIQRTSAKAGKREKALEIAGTLTSAQAMVRQLIESGNANGILDLLQNCQQLATALGEFLEKNFPNAATETVPILEKYCEYIFTLYTYLTDDASPEIDLALNINDEEEAVRAATEIVSAKAAEKKKILFLVSRAKWWKLLKNRYNALKADPDNKVMVMVVPWYVKDCTGSLAEMKFEKEDFPDDIDILPYNEISIEEILPDEIITQDPFENCTPGWSIHPYFYASRIRKFTKCLTFISPYIVDDFGPDDERGLTSLKYCCNVPGVILADRIIVSSEAIKQAYVKNISEFTGLPGWAEKIETDEFFTAPKAEKEVRPEEKSGEKSDDAAEARKLLCFHTGASVLIKNPEESIKKLEEVMAVFESHKDRIEVIWWGDAAILETLSGKLGTPELRAIFEKLTTEIKQKGIGNYCISPEENEAVEKCTAYYGDGSYVMNKFRRAGKPVMQMDL